MIITTGGFTTIRCDKCHKESTAGETNYNDVFYREGWGLKGAKHYCKECLHKVSLKLKIKNNENRY